MSSRSEILFISDLHLSQSKPEITQQFLTFIKTRAIDARVLYILGDLFEVWVGDDNETPEFDALFQTLKDYSAFTPIYYLHGNRDFLIGEDLAQRTGLTLLPDPSVIQLDDHKVGLTHGDLLCSDDKEYMEFRKLVRSEEWQQEFLQKPLQERQSIADELRAKSLQAMQDKSYDIMDANQQTVLDFFNSLEIDTLIHGHTHRPAVHNIDDSRQRIVLGDWNPQPSYISWNNGQFSLIDHRVKLTG